jgi:hypothetical protein
MAKIASSMSSASRALPGGVPWKLRFIQISIPLLTCDRINLFGFLVCNVSEEKPIEPSWRLGTFISRSTASADKLAEVLDEQWDSELIDSIFWPIDAHRILQIPLTPEWEDLVAWHYNKTGLFTARSAYYRQWDYRPGQLIIASGIIDLVGRRGTKILLRVQTTRSGKNFGILKSLVKLKSLDGEYYKV